MAVDATTIWEFRATNGSATNGGGFADLDPGTSVDYSNQNGSELTINDGATAGIGNTTLTSAGGGFTAAMAGNVIYLQTGTNLTDGWYQITVVTDTNTVTLDRAPDDGVGGVSGADGEVGGALDILTDTFLDDTDIIVPGQTIWIKNDGTMTLTGAISTTVAGTDALVITIEGYNTSRGDNPTFTNRPLIAAGANTFEFTAANRVYKHFRVTTTSQDGFEPNGGQVVRCINISVNNSSGTANRYALKPSIGFFGTGLDLQSTNGRCVYLYGVIHSSYLHDSNTGWYAIGATARAISCVIDTCTTGADINTRDGETFINCTIYNCTTGVSGTTGNALTMLNNIIDGCTTGVTWSSVFGNNFLDYNCWDNGTDTNNVSKGNNAVTGDPSMTNPAAGDFSIPNSSNCVDVALDAGDLTGATV
jgi:hypothetical protein